VRLGAAFHEVSRLAVLEKVGIYPSVVYGMVSDGERIHQVLAIHNPVPTTRTPMGRRRPVVNLVGFCVELAGVHSRILARTDLGYFSRFREHHK